MQITRTTPLRRMILQFRQIFFTDANTFIFVSGRRRRRASSGTPGVAQRHLILGWYCLVLGRYFARNVILARDRS